MASDLRTRRIPNALTGPAILAGAALNVLYGGRAGLTASLLGLGMVVHLARQGRLREKLLATAVMIGGAAAERSIEPLTLSADAPGAVSLPYSVPLGLGTLAALVMGAA